jgi:hypothetical protein
MATGYRYKVTVEPIADRHGEPIEKPAVTFEVENHDEILSIIERIQGRADLGFDQEEAAAFATGLKLFSEVMIKNKSHPLFEPMRPAFLEFMKRLKNPQG